MPTLPAGECTALEEAEPANAECRAPNDDGEAIAAMVIPPTLLFAVMFCCCSRCCCCCCTFTGELDIIMEEPCELEAEVVNSARCSL